MVFSFLLSFLRLRAYSTQAAFWKEFFLPTFLRHMESDPGVLVFTYPHDSLFKIYPFVFVDTIMAGVKLVAENLRSNNPVSKAKVNLYVSHGLPVLIHSYSMLSWICCTAHWYVDNDLRNFRTKSAF